MKIIPAIDLIDGKCVRLSQGDYGRKITYSESPVEMAKRFEDQGIRYLHLVDLDGAKGSNMVHYKMVEKIVNQTHLEVDFGGGIRSDEDIKAAFDCGVTKVNIGSTAVKNKSLMRSWLTEYGPHRVILSADCKHRKIFTEGWLEAWEMDVIDFLQDYEEEGVETVVVTDIAKDGMLSGPSFSLYQDILKETGLELIASGGISTEEDLIRLKKQGCTGAIIGKALYEKKINIKEIIGL